MDRAVVHAAADGAISRLAASAGSLGTAGSPDRLASGSFERLESGGLKPAGAGGDGSGGGGGGGGDGEFDHAGEQVEEERLDLEPFRSKLPPLRAAMLCADAAAASAAAPAVAAELTRQAADQLAANALLPVPVTAPDLETETQTDMMMEHVEMEMKLGTESSSGHGRLGPGLENSSPSSFSPTVSDASLADGCLDQPWRGQWRRRRRERKDQPGGMSPAAPAPAPGPPLPRAATAAAEAIMRHATEALAGPHTCCSPRHSMALDSRNQGSRFVA